MKKKVVFLLVSVAMLVYGCAPEKDDVLDSSSSRYGVVRSIDKEAGVVCWIYTSYQKGGISCLPIKETLFGE